MTTLRDVAIHAGVSIASVSTVVNGTAAVSPAMRERVQRSVAELGYVPHGLARSLKLGRTSTIGLVLPDITNPHFSGLASAIEEACDQAGFTLTLCSTTDNAEKEVRQLQVLRAQRAAGVIFVPGGSRTHDIAALSRLLSVPAVLLDRTLPGLDRASVALDNIAAGRIATEHLLREGHSRIGILAGSPGLAISRERVDGCRDALRERAVADTRIVVKDGGFQTEPSFHATLNLLRTARPTAIVAANNHATVGVMQALAACGLRCPEDVSVVGIDDFTWAAGFSPRLTAVAQPMEAMGRDAVRLLLNQDRRAPKAYEQIVHQPRLIVRGSTAPLGGR